MYKQDYFYFFQFLVEAAERNHSWFTKVKAEWDLNVFSKQVEVKEGTSPSGGVDTEVTGSINRAAEIAQRLEAMQINSSDDEDQESEHDVQTQSLPADQESMQAPEETDYDDIYGDEVLPGQLDSVPVSTLTSVI
jgi:hypothetical protein